MKQATLSLLAFASILTSGLVGTTGCANSVDDDELAGETSSELADNSEGKADGDSTFTFYTVTQDFRRCASPVCGGKFLARVNRSSTKCHTGGNSDRCYVPAMDFSTSGLTQDDVNGISSSMIVRGRFANKTYAGRGNLGTFIVSEAWAAQSGTEPSGVFVRVKDTGIRCITTPCPSIGEHALNSNRTASIADIDFSPADMTAESIDEAGSDIFNDGLIIAGDRYFFTSNSTRAKGRTATAVYRKVTHAAPAACFVGGCSSQICGDEEGIISTCEFRPEYACYASATCARQADGACGWTATPELEACLGQ